jgi:hypothetical protein
MNDAIRVIKTSSANGVASAVSGWAQPTSSQSTHCVEPELLVGLPELTRSIARPVKPSSGTCLP